MTEEVLIIQDDIEKQSFYKRHSSKALYNYLESLGHSINTIQKLSSSESITNRIVIINLDKVNEILNILLHLQTSRKLVIIYIDKSSHNAFKIISEILSDYPVNVLDYLMICPDYFCSDDLSPGKLPKYSFNSKIRPSIKKQVESIVFNKTRYLSWNRSKLVVTLLHPQNLLNLTTQDLINAFYTHQHVLISLANMFEHVSLLLPIDCRYLTPRDFSVLSLPNVSLELVSIDEISSGSCFDNSDLVVLLDKQSSTRSCYLDSLIQLSSIYQFIPVLSEEFPNSEIDSCYQPNIYSLIDTINNPSQLSMIDQPEEIDKLDLAPSFKKNLSLDLTKNVKEQGRELMSFLVVVFSKVTHKCAKTLHNKYTTKVLLVDWLLRKSPLSDLWIEYEQNSIVITCTNRYLFDSLNIVSRLITTQYIDENDHTKATLKLDAYHDLTLYINKINALTDLLNAEDTKSIHLESILYNLNQDIVHQFFDCILERPPNSIHYDKIIE